VNDSLKCCLISYYYYEIHNGDFFLNICSRRISRHPCKGSMKLACYVVQKKARFSFSGIPMLCNTQKKALKRKPEPNEL